MARPAARGASPRAWHADACPRYRNATTELRKQFGLEAGQILLGHSKADVTQVYAERDMTGAAAATTTVG